MWDMEEDYEYDKAMDRFVEDAKDWNEELEWV